MVVKVGRFGSTKLWPSIHGVDGAFGMAWLLINKDALECVDVGEEL